MNTQDFDRFTLAAFDFDDLSSMVNTALMLFHKDESEGLVSHSNEIDIKRFYNPSIGGSCNRIFCFWKCASHPQKIFLTSNGDFYTLCNAIHNQLKCNVVRAEFYNENEEVYPFYAFHYYDARKGKRYVQAYKDPRWVFYQQGTPLPFENLSLYENRLKKKRLNNDIIIDYLSQLNIDFFSIDKDVIESYIIRE